MEWGIARIEHGQDPTALDASLTFAAALGRTILLRALQSSIVGTETGAVAQPRLLSLSNNLTSRSACGNGSGRSTMSLTRLNIAVLTATPIASVPMTTSANLGFARSTRAACHMSCHIYATT